MKDIGRYAAYDPRDSKLKFYKNGKLVRERKTHITDRKMLQGICSRWVSEGILE